MKLAGKRIALLLAISAIGISAIVLLWVADEFPATRYRGDGTISGGPVFGYSIEFGKIPFWQAGEYVFHFQGVPHEELALELHAEGISSDDDKLRVKTTIEASIDSQNGRNICRASGPPLAHGQNPTGWVISGDGAYWHWNCTWVQFEPYDSYTLTLRIRDVDPKTTKISLVPTLRSRGLDLP